MTTWNRAGSWMLMAVVGTTGCDLFGSSGGEKSGEVMPGVGGTATGGSGTSGGSPNAGGSMSGGGASAGGGSPADAGGAAASCGQGLHGPSMVAVQAPNGAQYCIDRTEVTQGQYQEFLKQVTTKPSSVHALCGDNATFAPVAAPPDPVEGKNCDATNWTPNATPNRPVVCIDWCDAYGYCAWAGKRLCGKIGGGGLTITADNPAVDPNKSQWFNACSQGGKTAYPYGDTYDPQACEGADVSKLPDGGWAPKKDVGARAGCRGTSEPYSEVRDLSGSVYELTDECAVDPTSPGQTTLCGARGGATGATAEQLACSSIFSFTVGRTETVVGFRCCKDLP